MTEGSPSGLVRNERIKLLAGFVNAIGLGLIATAVLRALLETGTSDYWAIVLWFLTGLAIRCGAHYSLGRLR